MSHDPSGWWQLYVTRRHIEIVDPTGQLFAKAPRKHLGLVKIAKWLAADRGYREAFSVSYGIDEKTAIGLKEKFGELAKKP